MNKYAAVEEEDGVRIHMPPHDGNYATLCGLDGNDWDEAANQRPAKVSLGANINCEDCKAIWQHVQKYKTGDFA